MSFFDVANRYEKLNEKDKLVALNAAIPWERFLGPLVRATARSRKSEAGRKRKDVLMMFKVLVLQSLYGLSDDDMEFQVRDRLSFTRFLGLGPNDATPDAKTIADSGVQRIFRAVLSMLPRLAGRGLQSSVAARSFQAAIASEREHSALRETGRDLAVNELKFRTFRSSVPSPQISAVSG